jgi:hypothetical protein
MLQSTSLSYRYLPSVNISCLLHSTSLSYRYHLSTSLKQWKWVVNWTDVAIGFCVSVSPHNSFPNCCHYILCHPI